jgi:hypothetical protein
MLKNIILTLPVSKYITSYSSHIIKRRFPHNFSELREPLICDLCKKRLEEGDIKMSSKDPTIEAVDEEDCFWVKNR